MSLNLGALTVTLDIESKLQKAATEFSNLEKRANDSMKKISDDLKEAGESMRKFGRSWSMNVTAPITLLGGAAAKTFMDFESSMTKIVGLVGVAEQQVDEWADEILRIAPSLGKAPAELADAMFFVTSAGIRGAEAMEVLEMSAKASAAGLGETKVVADLVTSAMNAYGIANLSAAEATDTLVATVREGKAQADALAGSMGMVLPIASYMGVSFDQVGGAIAAMTRTGTKANTAAIQLRQILNSLIKPSKQAEEALVGMKTSSAELRQTIKEDGLLAALMKIRELTNKYGEDAIAKVFPNIRALSGVLDIMGKNFKSNQKIMDSVSDAAGSMEFAFGEASETLEFRWNQVIAASKVALTDIGKAIKTSVMPGLGKLVSRLQNAAEWFRNLNEDTQQGMLRWAAFLAVIGPVSLALGFMATNILPGLIKIVRVATTAVRKLTVAMLNNPAIAIAAALAAVATALILVARRAKQVAIEQNKLNILNEDAIESTVEHQTKLEQLFDTATDETKSLKKRQEAVKILNRLSPEYFGNLDLENIATEKGTKAKKAYIAELIREAKVKGAQEELIRLEKKKYKEIEQMEGARLKFGQKVAMVLSSVVIGQSKAITNASMKAIANMNQTETELDASIEKIKKYMEEIIEPGDLEKLFGVDDVIDDEVVDKVIAVGEVMDELAASIDFANASAAVFGGTFDRGEAMIDAYRNAIDRLLKDGIDPLDERIVKLKGDLDFWEGLKKSTDEVTKQMDNLMKTLEEQTWEDMNNALMEVNLESWEASQGIEELILKMHGLGEKSNIVGGIVSNAFQGMTNVITNALNSTENIFKAFGKFFGDFIKGMVIKLIAATIAAATLALVLTLIPGLGGANAFKTIKAAEGFGGMFKAGLTQFAGLQKGGIVPPGYPNDTFPALLSSGEKVIPLEHQTKQTSQLAGEVVFRIEGDELVGILRKRESVEENY